MKQTKPYGRAHLTSAERALLAQQDKHTAAQQPTLPPYEAKITPQPPLLVQEGQPPVVGNNTRRLRQFSIYVLVLTLSLSLFVLVRDSLLMAQLLEQVSSREAVMVCKEGRMHYPDYNPLDRLLGKGHFVCTEWSIRRGMLSIPRPYY